MGDDYTYSSEIFLSELLRISTDIVWKNPQKANENEDPSHMIEVEQYDLARKGQLTFDLIYRLDEEALLGAGFTQTQAAIWSEDPTEVPSEFRDLCAHIQAQYTLEHYVESNNYYRMLNGLPDLEDTEYLYNTKYADISDPFDPIHTLDAAQLYALETRGFMDELIAQYPEKKYLRYLTDRKVDFYTARHSEEYAIMWMPSSEYTTLVDAFKEVYESCRFMTVAVFHMKNMQKDNTEYCGFIAMNILFQTIMHMHQRFLDTDITREFYDEASLRYVYDSYGVPYYSAIPVEYHREIVKAMNRLISYKGSTRVLYELFDIFGLTDTSIFEYYLMKVHKFENGKPVFSYKEDGTLDVEKMYEIKFGRVRLYDDPATDIVQKKNQVAYHTIADADPYWITDEELMAKIYGEEYNFIDSKYLGIETTFNLMKIMYEYCYYIKMIIDNRVPLASARIYNTNIRENVSLFDMVIYLSALICDKYGYEGNIPYDPHQIGQVLGFNFKEDIFTLRQHITENDYLREDTALLDYLLTMDVNSLESVTAVYKNLTAFRTYVANKMLDAKEEGAWWAYYELYNMTMYSEYMKDVFKKSDGRQASSFADLLSDTNPTLYDRLINRTGIDLDREISESIYMLKSSCSELKCMEYMDDINTNMVIEYLFKLIEFFKSAKADVTGYEVVYSLVSKYHNFVKFLDYIFRVHDTYYLDPDRIDSLSDLVFTYYEYTRLWHNFLHLEDEIPLVRDELFRQVSYRFEDYFKASIHMIYDLTSNMDFLDYISDDFNLVFLPDEDFAFQDNMKLLYDDVLMILQMILWDKNAFFTVIKDAVEKHLLYVDRDTILPFVSKLFIFLSMRLGNHSYQLKDEIPLIQELDWEQFRITIMDILLGLQDHTPVHSNLSMEEALYADEKTDADPAWMSNYTFEDAVKSYDINVLNKTLVENVYTILMKFVSQHVIFYTNDTLTFDETLGRIDWGAVLSEGALLDTDLIEYTKHFPHTSLLTMTDSLQLIYSRQEE